MRTCSAKGCLMDAVGSYRLKEPAGGVSYPLPMCLEHRETARGEGLLSDESLPSSPAVAAVTACRWPNCTGNIPNSVGFCGRCYSRYQKVMGAFPKKSTTDAQIAEAVQKWEERAATHVSAKPVHAKPVAMKFDAVAALPALVPPAVIDPPVLRRVDQDELTELKRQVAFQQATIESMTRNAAFQEEQIAQGLEQIQRLTEALKRPNPSPRALTREGLERQYRLVQLADLLRKNLQTGKVLLWGGQQLCVTLR